MSFSNEVRQKIYSIVNDKDKKFACLYGMLLYCKCFNQESIVIQTENRLTAKLFVELIDSVFHSNILVKVNDNNKINISLYTCSIHNADNINQILTKYKIDCENKKINYNFITTSNVGAFVAGIFLICGSVNDPAKGYHLEFTAPSGILAEDLCNLLSEKGINAKVFARKKFSIVYIKDSESIEDTLTFIGAQDCTLKLMDTKIIKDIRNKANRLTNCDSANIDKVVNAAMKQIEDIRLIECTMTLQELGDDLRELSELRLINPDMSLQELGNMLNISRSGVNHRFKRLAKIADEIREK